MSLRSPGLALALLLLAAWPSAAQPTLPELTRLELKTRLEGLLTEEASVRATLEELRHELVDLDARMVQGQTQSLELQRRRARLEALMQEIGRQRAELEPRVAAREAAYGRRLRALYLLGPEARDWVWASAGDARDALVRTDALTRLLAAQHADLEDIRRRRLRLASLEGSLAVRRQELASLEADMAANGALLSDLKRQQAQVVDGLEEHRRQLTANIAALTEAQARLARTFALLEDHAAGGPPAPPRTRVPGTLKVLGRPAPPVEGRPLESGRREQHGVTIEARQEAPVRAPWAGRVVFAEWLAGYGKVVVLDHGDRVHSVLAYLGTISVTTGDRVRAGQVVGAVDKAGRLYVEVRKAARPLEPGRWLQPGAALGADGAKP